MPKFTGTVKKNDLEGGFWELHADDGDCYQLHGGDDGLRKQGQKVEIDGAIDKNAMGIGMSGPILKVKSWRKI
jgi:hypothetical protein